MSNQNVKDGRSFFVLPQSYEGGGYYAYGAPGGGISQYAHPAMLTTIFNMAAQWAAIESRKFGIGDISLANGVRHPDHKTHRSGLEVDIRPLRRDGKQLPCTISEAQYDRVATSRLIGMFFATGRVKQILFNDPAIRGVHAAKNHSNHFHVVLISKG